MYIHIASTYSIITLFAGDIWSSEIIVNVQECRCKFECVILCCLANHLLHIFAIFLTLITERERGESDDETWRLLIHISSTVAFQAALWWNPSRFIWPQGKGLCRLTAHRYEWGLSREVCVCMCESVWAVGLSGLSPPLGLEQFSLVSIHL